GCFASLGQAAEVPVQVSATSHTPAEARHTVVEGWKPSAGQAADVPVHVSATSQGPADARQTVVEGWKPSAGQGLPVPLQGSATSHGPVDARQTVPAATGVWVTWPRAGLQVSIVHGLPSSVTTGM